MSTEQEQKAMDKKTEQIIQMLITKLGDLPTTGGRSIVERRVLEKPRFTKFRRDIIHERERRRIFIDYDKIYFEKLRATKISTLLEKDAKEDLRELLRDFEKKYYPK